MFDQYIDDPLIEGHLLQLLKGARRVDGVAVGRSPTSASKTSTTAMIFDSRGIAFPFSPSGYPEPSSLSWWCSTIVLKCSNP